MEKQQNHFWLTKTSDEMINEEWESLCDHCGICCLHKVEDENTGEIKLIGVSCEFLDTENCRCLVYEVRKLVNPDCIVLSPSNIKQKKWLPDTCAYRRIAEGRELEQWHHLISGDHKTVHEAKISVCEKVVSGKYVHPEDVDANVFK
jgi:uncharacterized cysteine cluster protein YcgN (CxxCxxCC family)